MLGEIFLLADARVTLADYPEKERPQDVSELAEALFLSATGLPARSADDCLSPRSINAILEQIGKWPDAELKDTAQHISPLRPHVLRHTFAFALSRQTGADAYGCCRPWNMPFPSRFAPLAKDSSITQHVIV